MTYKNIVVIGIGIATAESLIPFSVYAKEIPLVVRIEPSVHTSPHHAWAGKDLPMYIMQASTTESVVERNGTVLARNWRKSFIESTYCSVHAKDVLFAVLWGSAIVPPKHNPSRPGWFFLYF